MLALLWAFAVMNFESGLGPGHAAAQSTAASAAHVNGQRILDADSEPGNWLTHGRTYAETRFSPLKQINDRNIEAMRQVRVYEMRVRNDSGLFKRFFNK